MHSGLPVAAYIPHLVPAGLGGRRPPQGRPTRTAPGRPSPGRAPHPRPAAAAQAHAATPLYPAVCRDSHKVAALHLWPAHRTQGYTLACAPIGAAPPASTRPCEGPLTHTHTEGTHSTRTHQTTNGAQGSRRAPPPDRRQDQRDKTRQPEAEPQAQCTCVHICSVTACLPVSPLALFLWRPRTKPWCGEVTGHHPGASSRARRRGASSRGDPLRHDLPPPSKLRQQTHTGSPHIAVEGAGGRVDSSPHMLHSNSPPSPKHVGQGSGGRENFANVVEGTGSFT